MNACPNCGEVIDVSSCAPYSKVMCPTCNSAIRVRAEFHHFSLKKQIGEGGMSRVFLANDNTLNRMVALKILNSDFSKDAARTAQFEKEARITAAISHPNVVKVFSVGQDQEHFFIAMELVPNGSLDDLIAKKRSITEERALEIGEQMAKGLKAAFTEGLIHRDMKPGNMLFAEDDTAKIVDFGLALVFEKDVDESDEIWATPYYVPPEKLHKEPEDFRSDIYSLGASLFHALAGKPPYAADTSSLEELKEIKEKSVSLKEFAPSVSDVTCELIDRMMARNPADRHGSYDELIGNFQYAKTVVASGGTIVGMNTSPKNSTGKWAAIAAVIGLLVIVLAIMISGDDEVTPVANKGDAGMDLSEQGLAYDGTGRTPAQKFVDARNMMLKGRLAHAAKIFQGLSTDPATKQPTLNWARFNLGICALMDGRKKEALQVFSAIQDGGKISTDDGDANLAKFFVSVSEKMTDPLPVMASVGDDYNLKSSESLALLLFGLKNWQFGEFKEAAALFAKFRSATIRPSDNWADEYKTLLAQFGHDIEILVELPDVGRDASLDEVAAAVKKMNEIVNGLNDSGQVKARVLSRLERLQHSMKVMNRSSQEAEVMRLAKLLDEEKVRFDALLLSLVEFRSKLRFREAITALKKESFEHPEVKQAYDDELYVWESAERFLEILIKDLNLQGYKGVIIGVSGNSANAEVTSATRDKLEFRVASGELSMPLESVSIPGLVAMAEAMPPQQDMAEYLLRREVLVMFAYITGEIETALRVGEELMVDSREFRQRWKQITGRRQG
jgi:serine/threonine protein kinase